MMGLKIWERYFLQEIAKGFFLFIACFYFLYVLIDYSSHAKAFTDSNIPLLDLVNYYLCMFVRRIDLIVPFGLLLASTRTLVSLNLNNELVAMLASGLSLHKLLRPFLFISLIAVLLMCLHQEFLLPASQVHFRLLEDTYLKDGARKRRLQEQALRDLTLQDDSTLIYQQYDSARREFSSVFWIQSIDEIYRIQTLSLAGGIPQASFVDHLSRQDDGRLTLVDSSDEQSFPQIMINPEAINDLITGPRDQSLSRLWRQLPAWTKRHLSEHDAAVSTFFQYKLAIPWLCLLVIVGPAPFCVRFSRNLRVFFIYALSIFGLITFYLLTDTAIILGENQIVPPLVAGWGPLALFLSFTGWNYARMR
jgi:lipopolysaccharide export system permease protein